MSLSRPDRLLVEGTTAGTAATGGRGGVCVEGRAKRGVAEYPDGSGCTVSEGASNPGALATHPPTPPLPASPPSPQTHYTNSGAKLGTLPPPALPALPAPPHPPCPPLYVAAPPPVLLSPSAHPPHTPPTHHHAHTLPLALRFARSSSSNHLSACRLARLPHHPLPSRRDEGSAGEREGRAAGVPAVPTPFPGKRPSPHAAEMLDVNKRATRPAGLVFATEGPLGLSWGPYRQGRGGRAAAVRPWLGAQA
ncbi:WAS/WASL-interacting protein family member 3-like [Scylla paramamosain]|uniref:WAS/WASL-interacting protein family member 3-like n=1 Tax=Scylla paramamosain TaxID=85552 RepID=UPI003083636D